MPFATAFEDNISIHALRKESDSIALHHDRRGVISIHALRKESDLVDVHVIVSA